MFKKLGIVAIAVVAGLFLLNTTNLGSYAGTMFKKMKHSVHNQVPLDFEIERVKNDVSQLVPDMRKHISEIAQEMVAVDNLKADVANTRVELAKQKSEILTMRSDLENAKNVKTITYNSIDFPVSRVREKLSTKWQAYKVGEESLKSKERLLEAREESLSVARDQLGAMRSKKEQLEVEVARLEAEMKNLRLAQTKSNFQFDDSRLARINASLASIRDRLKVESTEMALRGTYANDLDIPIEKKVQTQEVLKEIDNHFGTTEKTEATVGK